jgi:thiol-disulfide isomerase/thioredoxin
LVLLLLAGCREASPPADSTAPPPAVVPPQVAMRVASLEDFQEVLKQCRSRVVLVDYWATWCGPCVKEFPEVQALARKYPDDVALITVSLDEPDQREAVLEFLTKQNATSHNLISQFGAAGPSFENFGIENGAIPAIHLYDRHGNLIEKLSSGDPTKPSFTMADLETALVGALGRP